MSMTSTRDQQDDGKDQKVPPTKLNIIWGKDSRYWRLHDNQSEGSSYAELLQVCWLEVTGKFEGLPPKKKYSVGFTISFNQDTFGFDNCPIFLMAKVGKKGTSKWKKISIPSSKRGASSYDIPEQSDGKLIVETVAGDPDESAVQVGLYEVWSGKWKGGLKIHHAFAQQVAD